MLSRLKQKLYIRIFEDVPSGEVLTVAVWFSKDRKWCLEQWKGLLQVGALIDGSLDRLCLYFMKHINGSAAEYTHGST